MASASAADRSLSSARQRELERMANKSKPQVALVAFIFGPLGYALLGKWELAILCLLTVNWFLAGFFIVPWHTRWLISRARNELDKADAA